MEKDILDLVDELIESRDIFEKVPGLKLKPGSKFNDYSRSASKEKNQEKSPWGRRYRPFSKD